MRFVVMSGLMGFLVALIGVTMFGMGWGTALAIWLASGPVGVVLALASTLTAPAGGTKAAGTAPVRQQAA